jgi:hypothetical protein
VHRQQAGAAPNALEQPDVGDTPYATTEHNALVADTGQHQRRAAIRSGLGAACSSTSTWIPRTGRVGKLTDSLM